MREIGVYWYSFSNHCTRRCIYVKRNQKKKLSSSLVSSSSIRAPSFWRSHASHINRLTSSPRPVPSRARLGMQAMMFPVACPLASVYILRPGAGCFCILLISLLIPPLEYIDNLHTNRSITALCCCSLVPVNARRRSLLCVSEPHLSFRSCTSTAKCLVSLRPASLGFPRSR